jgi:hypothetical protein
MQGRCNVKRGFPSFWGDGSDGLLSAGDTYIAGTDFEQYSDFCIRQFSEINWAPGSAETLTVDQPCRGLILFVDGDVNIGANATISMKKLGSILPANPSKLIDLYGDSLQMRHIVSKLKALHGGAGGNGRRGQSYYGSPGTGGPGRVCQGGFGGGGSASGNASNSKGGDGGSIVYPDVLGFPGKGPDGDGLWGGGGNSGWSGSRNSGGGRPYGAGGGGAAMNAGNGGDGEHTGGFILIIAKGNVSIAGTLDVTGGNGGNGGDGEKDGGGGGGAGGGVISIFANGVIDTSSAIKTLTGGSPGSRGSGGTVGSDGTYYEERLFV